MKRFSPRTHIRFVCAQLKFSRGSGRALAPQRSRSRSAISQRHAPPWPRSRRRPSCGAKALARLALALPIPAAGWWPSKLTLRTPNYPADTHACVRARACAHAHEQLRRLSPHADGIEFCSYPMHVQLAMHAIDAVPAAIAVDLNVVLHTVARRWLGAAAGRRLPPPRRHTGPSRHGGWRRGRQNLNASRG